MVKHELGVTSYDLRVENLKAQAELQKCEFKPRSSNSGVTSSTLRVASSNPRLQELFNQ